MQLDFEFIANSIVDILKGIPMTLELTFITMLVSTPIAFLMAVRRTEKNGVKSKIISGYVSLMRGTPVVLQILFIYSMLPSLLNHLIRNVLHLNLNIFSMNPIVYAFLIFILNNTAVLSETFRSALMTVNHGQMEAAMTVGLTKGQAYRRIIIPQAFVEALPNLCNVTIGLLKSTSLAFLMSVQDITARAKMQAAYGYNYIEAYLLICLIYIALCTIVQIVFYLVEKRCSSFKKIITI